MSSATSTSSSSIDSDISLLKQCTSHLDSVLSSLVQLASDAPWSKLGYFDATQHDEIEHLFFRFLVSRRVLVSLALHQKTATHDNPKEGDVLQHALTRADDSFADTTISEDDHALQTLVSLDAAMALFVYEGSFVRMFRHDGIAVAKLNEKFYQSDIARNTYNELSLECTDASNGGRLRSLEHAYLLFCEESNNDNNISSITNRHLVQLLAQDKRAQEIAEQIHALVQKGDGLIQDLVGQSLLLPSLNNQLRHAKVAEITRHIKGGTYRIMTETRAHTFKGVSRLKSPTAYLIKFSNEQKRDVLERLQPGDMIFTYTAGYMSDVFIPGAFKHGITFVGSLEERSEAGLTAESIERMRDDMPEEEVAKLLQQFKISTVAVTPSTTRSTKGEKMQTDLPEKESTPAANIIEAVAEGVIFNNLFRIMDTHVNRLLILRPRITFEERTYALISIFRYLGDDYDFGFNFADVSAVVCTEIQYHAFQGKGQLSFELTKRAGHPTLSADDIANYYLAKPESFDFVLLALEDMNSSQHDAKVYVGDDGKDALIDLMKGEVHDDDDETDRFN